MKTELITVSPVMLENAVKARHMTLKQASIKLGYNSTQLGVCCKRGYITRPFLVALEKVLGITEEEITVPKVEVVENTPEVIDHGHLYNIIYNAVRNAMKDALNDDGKKTD